MNKVRFDFDQLERRDRYKLLTGLIVPRPIGWIGTLRPDGTRNLAPFSFFNVVSSNPPVVIFSAGSHPDRPKDSGVLAESTGEFTVNIVSEAVAEAMSATSASVGAEIDEFELAGLNSVAGSVVAAPMVVESPANLECVVRQVIPLDRGALRLVLGNVVAVHVREDLLDGTRIDNDALAAIGRMAGNTYTHTRDRFEIVRPD